MRGAAAAIARLLAADPAAADACNALGQSPLDVALRLARRRRESGLSLLRAARLWPHMYALSAAGGPASPLFSPAHIEAARHLVVAGRRADALASLFASPLAAQHLWPDAVAAHVPMSEAEWALVPAACIGRTLPAALAQGPAQAALAAQRLPPADAARLRTAALALARVQRRAAAPLPAALVDKMLALGMT